MGSDADDFSDVLMRAEQDQRTLTWKGQARTAEFAEGKIDKVYQHWADAGSGEWNNNILSDIKSDYFEGEVIPHVFAYKASAQAPLVPGSTYSFVITHDYYQSSTNAGGFIGLAPYNASRDAELLTPDAIDFPAEEGVPGSAIAAVDASGVSYSEIAAPVGKRAWRVDFQYSEESTKSGFALIYFGLQIARPGEAGAGSLGASAWSGGSLQTTVDINGSGATSIQLAPAAVIAGSISGVKFNVIIANGVRDEGEPGIEGWTIILDNDADPTRYIASYATDASGGYTF
jgi:hypothetical protein